jgi:hypothetical protein
MILDTGDNYILAVNGDGYDDALDLYKSMDLTINEIPTGHFVNTDTANFVFNSIGKVIAYGFGDTDASIRIDIPEKLTLDIGKAIDYSKVKSFWENLQFPAKPKKKYDPCMLLDYSRLLPNPDTLNQDKLHIHIETPSTKQITGTQAYYVLFNNIYNLSLVVNDKDLKCSISKLTENFPEFLNAVQIPDGMTSDAVTSFYGVFHKKSFDSIEDIQKKLQAFKDLFNINDKSNKEKEGVKQYFKWNYNITDEVDKRMKANDLYKELINHMCIPYDDAAAFKKRLAGYLIELNLQKRRFSDAYYFYGIEKKEIPKLTLQEIEERRMKERQEWKAAYSNCDTPPTYSQKTALDNLCSNGNIVDYFDKSPQLRRY